MEPDKLSFKKLQLKTLITFYENRIQWLSTDSRLYFGLLKGSKVALLVEASDHLSCNGDKWEEFTGAVRLLIQEQLREKEVVHLVQFGSETRPLNPEALPFATKKNM